MTGDTGNAENEQDAESDDPIEAIYKIIDRYYKGLKREEEGMGVD